MRLADKIHLFAHRTAQHRSAGAVTRGRDPVKGIAGNAEPVQLPAHGRVGAWGVGDQHDRAALGAEGLQRRHRFRKRCQPIMNAAPEVTKQCIIGLGDVRKGRYNSCHERLSVPLKFKVGNDLLFAAHDPGQDDGIARDRSAKRFFCHALCDGIRDQ